tara:strand:+ start:1487 stop:2626 length:1140 start_codon:yes stop_codon:yes gene_type:complete
MYKKKVIVFLGSRAEIGIIKPAINSLKKKFDVFLIINSRNSKNNFFLAEDIKIEKKNIFFLNLKIKDTKQDYIFDYLSKFIKSSKKYLKQNTYYFSVVLGDRYETLLFSYLCSFKKIPLVHFHGGETTFGSLDENYRHAITKLSSLHFVSTEKYRDKVISLGENPKKVIDIGSLSLFTIQKYKFQKLHNILRKTIKNTTIKPYFLVTFHPETYSKLTFREQIQPLLRVILLNNNYNFIFTSSNLDEGGNIITNQVKKFVKRNLNCFFVANLGHKNYLNLMKYSLGVLGNSSSGIIESPFMKTKCLNIGNRQEGRLISNQTISVKNNFINIKKGMNKLIKLKTKKISLVYYKKNGLKKFEKIVFNENFNTILPKIFYEKK